MNRNSPLYCSLRWCYQPLKWLRQTTCQLLGDFKRNRVCKTYLQGTEFKGLHLGCGPNYLKGWLNTDILFGSAVADFPLDASKTLPFPDETFNVVYAEEMVEHLTREDLPGLLKEIFRCLGPGGVFRLTTPNLDNVCKTYLEWDDEKQRQFEQDWLDGALDKQIFTNAMFNSWGHQFLYSFDLLEKILMEAGFSKVERCKPYHSDSAFPQLSGLEQRYGTEDHPWFTISMVVEATKA